MAFSMIVVSPTSTAAAYTNCVYVSPSDFFAPYVTFEKSKFTYKCIAHPSVVVGTIALNAMHRRDNGVFHGDLVKVLRCCAVPPPAESVTLSAYWLKGSHPAPDIEILSEIFKTNFLGHGMATGQSFAVVYEGETVILKINSDINLTLAETTTITIVWN